jgi:hypothetical protein
MTIEDLFNEYLETLDQEHEDESYMSDYYLHEIGLKGFLEWLKTTHYEITVSK